MFISFPSFIEIRTPEGGLSKIGTIIAKVFSFNYARVATECDTISQIVPLRFSQALWFFITHSQSQSRSKYPKIRMPATPKYYVWFSYRIYLKRSVHSHSMGWPRLVGSFQSQVSFAEYSLFYRALLQKRPIILRSLLIVATPYLCGVCTVRSVSAHYIHHTHSLKLCIQCTLTVSVVYIVCTLYTLTYTLTRECTQQLLEVQCTLSNIYLKRITFSIMMMMMMAFITLKSNLVPLFEGL